MCICIYLFIYIYVRVCVCVYVDMCVLARGCSTLIFVPPFTDFSKELDMDEAGG